MNGYEDHENTVANRLRQLMDRWGIDPEKLEDLSGVRVGEILDILEGRHLELTDEQLVAFGLTFNRDPSWIQTGISASRLNTIPKDALRLMDLDVVRGYCMDREVVEPLRKALLQRLFHSAVKQRRHSPPTDADVAAEFNAVLAETHGETSAGLCPVSGVNCSYPFLCRDGNCVYAHGSYYP